MGGLPTVERFGRYWLHEKIGRGGMAEVYRATLGPDPEDYNFELALKVALDDIADDDYRYELMAREAAIAEQLSHPCIPKTYEVGEVDGRQYLAMELVEGLSLRRINFHCARIGQPVPAALATYVLLQVLRALDYVHEAKLNGFSDHGIVHRDVTPSNIRVAWNGSVKLIDFGVAQVGGHFDPYRLRGKLHYMAPEAIAKHIVTHQIDLWAVGAILYETISGHRLYPEWADEQIIMNAPRFKPPKASWYGKLPKPFIEAVNALMHPDPRIRPNTAARCYRQLRRAAREANLEATRPDVSRFIRNLARELELEP